MMKRTLILACVVCACLSALGRGTVSVDSLIVDSVVTPADSVVALRDSLVAPADTIEGLEGDTVRNRRYDYRNKKGIMRPVYMLLNYLANTNKATDKPFDWSIAAGPSYNPNSSFAIGGVVSGLYRWDREDRSLQKSDMSLYFNFGIKGYVEVGVRGNNYMPKDRQRWTYDFTFRNIPNDIWGIGWDMCSDDRNKGNYKQFQLTFSPNYLFRIADNLYAGVRMNFMYSKTRDFNFPVRNLQYVDLLNGQDKDITATGFGGELLYDSRDFGLNAYKGHYLSIQQLYYAPGITTYTFWSTDVTYRTYVPLWTKCVFAMEVHGLFNYGGTVPWTLMGMSGVDGRLRGYYRGRYRDNNIMEGQIEFRQRIKWRLGVVAWVGCANVFSDFKTIAWHKTLPSYGLGLRWEFKPRVNIRIDYGFTRDEGGVVFNINEAF